MILSALIGEFGLEEKIFPCDDTGLIQGGERLADSGFKIMTTLVGGINGSEAVTDGQFSKRRRTVFLPGGAVEKVRNGGSRHCDSFSHSNRLGKAPSGVRGAHDEKSCEKSKEENDGKEN
jgi:hypothetical protein